MDTVKPKALNLPPSLEMPATTWRYEDRRTAQLVMPQVYVGPAWSEANSGWIVARWPSQFKYCELEMQEGVLHQQTPRDASLSLLEVYIQSLPFLSDVLSSDQHRCLVHDDIGISRAPALVTCWVMQLSMQASGGTNLLNFFDASEFVRARRGCLSISETWWSQGEEVERLLQSRGAGQGGSGKREIEGEQSDFGMSSASTSGGQLKRQRMQEDDD